MRFWPEKELPAANKSTSFCCRCGATLTNTIETVISLPSFGTTVVNNKPIFDGPSLLAFALTSVMVPTSFVPFLQLGTVGQLRGRDEMRADRVAALHALGVRQLVELGEDPVIGLLGAGTGAPVSWPIAIPLSRRIELKNCVTRENARTALNRTPTPGQSQQICFLRDTLREVFLL